MNSADEHQPMSLARVQQLSVSLDGFATGEGQSHDAPFGRAGERLHEWMFATRYWTERSGQPGGSGGVDDAFLRPYEIGIGAEIMGAGKFGPPGWHDDPEWKGWWGPNPPFHTPTFILTHHPRPPIEMEGGTTFHVLDAPRAEPLETAREAAGGWSGGANDRLRSCNTQLSAGIHGRPGRTCNHRDSMDASTVGLVGVVVGGLLSAGTGFGAAFIQSKRDRDLWKRDELVRLADAEFLAIAEYLAAAGAWQTRLASFRAARRIAGQVDPAMLDTSAAEFYRRRFCAEMVARDSDVRAALSGVLPELQSLFNLAIEGVDEAPWSLQWQAVDRSIAVAAECAQTQRQLRMPHLIDSL